MQCRSFFNNEATPPAFQTGRVTGIAKLVRTENDRGRASARPNRTREPSDP